MQAGRGILARIAALDSRILAVAKRHTTVRLLTTAPGVGPVTAMAGVAACDDASRFRPSSSAGACLGLTPRRYGSGEISRNGRVSKRGDGCTRNCLFEAAHTTSIHPTLNANMWRPRSDYGENLRARHAG